MSATTDMAGNEVLTDHIVQLDDSNPPFAYCLIVVTDVYSWGIQGYALAPHESSPRLAFVRAKKENYRLVGAAWKVHSPFLGGGEREDGNAEQPNEQ